MLGFVRKSLGGIEVSEGREFAPWGQFITRLFPQLAQSRLPNHVRARFNGFIHLAGRKLPEPFSDRYPGFVNQNEATRFGDRGDNDRFLPANGCPDSSPAVPGERNALLNDFKVGIPEKGSRFQSLPVVRVVHGALQSHASGPPASKKPRMDTMNPNLKDQLASEFKERPVGRLGQAPQLERWRRS